MLDVKNKGSYSRAMNKLDREARAKILHLLCEGQSIRAITRLTGASKNTVIKLLVDAGQAAVWYQDRTLRNLPCTDIQADEIWGFVGSKQANTPRAKEKVQGDVWVWIATCRNTKLVPFWYVGHRSGHAARAFMQNLASRVDGNIQLSSDAFTAYA